MMDVKPLMFVKIFGAMVILLLIAFQAYATSNDKSSMQSISPLCKTLVDHHADADVSYKPGVDGHGKPVVPADVPSSTSLALPTKIAIPLTLDLVKFMHLNVGQYPYNNLGTGTEIQLGTLTLEGNQVFLNGKRLTPEDQEGLVTACTKISQHP